MTVIAVSFGTAGSVAPAPFSYNEFDDAETAGVLTSDLNDDTNTGTGYTLEVISVFTGTNGNSTICTADVGNFPEEVNDFRIASSVDTAALQIGGLTQGDTYSLELSGHFLNAARVSRYTVTPSNETTLDYTPVADAANPAAPVTFTGTIGAAGTIDIEGEVVSSNWYITGFYLTITAGSSATPHGPLGLPLNGPLGGPFS